MKTWENTVRRCTEIDWGSAASPVRERAALVLADTVGAIRAGARAPEIERLERQVLAWSGPGPVGAGAPLLTVEAEVGAEEAAFVYGTAATWFELDEAAASGVHAAAHVLGALLPMAQARDLSGATLLSGLLAGYETTAALYEGLQPRYPVHPHAGAAVIGAAAGVAYALGRDPLPCARIAASLPVIVTWDACFEGATVRHAFAGSAAAAAVRSLLLAESGFTGSERAATTLFARVLGQDQGLLYPRDPRLEQPRLLDSTCKRHAACLTCHTAIEAALRLPPIEPEKIVRVKVETTAAIAEKVDRRAAPNELSAKFSLPYAVAAALVTRRSDPTAFVPEPSVAALAGRMEVVVDPSLPDEDHAMPARVTVSTAVAKLREEVLDVPGSAAAPIAEEEMRAKFVRETGEEQLWEELLRIDKRPSCAGLLAHERPLEGGDGDHLDRAVEMAIASARRGDGPFAAVVVLDSRVVGIGTNTTKRDRDPSAHAEVNAIRDACRRLGTMDLSGAELYASCEPCPTCEALAILAGIESCEYAATKEEAAGAGWTVNAPTAALQHIWRSAPQSISRHRALRGAGRPFGAR